MVLNNQLAEPIWMNDSQTGARFKLHSRTDFLHAFLLSTVKIILHTRTKTFHNWRKFSCMWWLKVPDSITRSFNCCARIFKNSVELLVGQSYSVCGSVCRSTHPRIKANKQIHTYIHTPMLAPIQQPITIKVNLLFPTYYIHKWISHQNSNPFHPVLPYQPTIPPTTLNHYI